MDGRGFKYLTPLKIFFLESDVIGGRAEVGLKTECNVCTYIQNRLCGAADFKICSDNN